MNYEIRKITERDLEGKAYVHYKSWDETYRDFIDDKYLDNRSVDKCLELAKRVFYGNREQCYVAIKNDKVVGFVAYNSVSRTRVGASEIYGLYVLKEDQGKGVGKALISEAIKELPNKKINLYVLDKNIKAITFYIHMGFSFSGVEKEEDLKSTVIKEFEMVMEEK